MTGTEYKLPITDFTVVGGRILEMAYSTWEKRGWKHPKQGDSIIVEGKTRTIKFIFSSKVFTRVVFRPEVYFNKPDFLTASDLESHLMLIVDDFHDKH